MATDFYCILERHRQHGVNGSEGCGGCQGSRTGGCRAQCGSGGCFGIEESQGFCAGLSFHGGRTAEETQMEPFMCDWKME